MAIGMVQRFYEFGRFRLDGTGRVLFRGDQAVPLSPKAADVLLLLVQNSGSVVEKKELLNRVWHDAFVEEDSLTRTISILRKLLEAGYGGQECIATVSKRGYRFVVPAGARSKSSRDQIPRRNGGCLRPTSGRRNHFVLWIVDSRCDSRRFPRV